MKEKVGEFFFNKCLTDKPQNQKDPNSKWTYRGEKNCMQLFRHVPLSSWKSGAQHKCSSALQGGSKHSLSDLGAGTEQSPASHQSWQGWKAVWPLLMGERGEKEGGGGDGNNAAKKTKRPLTATTPNTRIGQSCIVFCASMQKKKNLN